MRTKVSVLVFVLWALMATAAFAQSPAFTYQGRLTDSTLPAAGTYQMQFAIFDAASAGTQIGTTITNNSVSVANGVFTVSLDFSPFTPFAGGADRWLEIAVKKPAEGSFTTLTPRQKLTTTPYATKSLSAANADNLGGLAANTYLQTNGNGSQLTNLNGANITNNTITTAALAPGATVATTTNLSALASLRWDLLQPKTFIASPTPTGMAFDGANMWVINSQVNTVTKHRISDGVQLAAYATGSFPYAIAFDGTNMWITSINGDSVTKLRASDGANLGTVSVGDSPIALTFDGTHIWVGNIDSDNVTKIRVSDNVVIGTYAAGNGPFGLAYDGANIWVTNSVGNTLTKVRASDGANLGSVATGTAPQGVAWDGTNVWVANRNSGNVMKIRPLDGVVLGTFALAATPVALSFDGNHMWVAHEFAANVTKIRISDGGQVQVVPLPANGRSVAFDGANIWAGTFSSITRTPAFP